ncbi:hypothetical protein EB230_23470 [Mesorhizobium sp. NZP2234]|uniref:hypothetical protein n=1 Tax=Mesorhizobium sp. NZP2234 TaxID=2483402 RepID=UPI0015575348|nr:hypothetical protein [Mesorhizobium sp. NZP2234]QKC91035.1 hypothetical protein EB230_23470 [Mesorhizobium sp. NZP2234]
MATNDTIGAAMMFNGAFPESKPAGAASWEAFRQAKEAAHAAPSPSALSGRAEPAASSLPAPSWEQVRANAPAAAPDSAVPAHLRLSSPETVAEYLPAPGAERYRTLLDSKQEAWILAIGGREEVDDKRTAIQQHQIRLKHLADEFPTQTVADDHPSKIDCDKNIARLKADIDRIEARRAPHIERQNAIGQALNSVDKYLTYAQISEMRPAADVRIGKADTLAIMADRIASIRNDVFDMVSKPWPSADAKARATAEIDFLAGKGKIEVGQSIQYRGQMAWPHIEDVTLRGFGRGMGDMYDVRQVASSTAIMCWLFRDAFIAKVHAEIDAAANDDIALDAEQRTAELARLNGRLLAEERVLGAIVWRDAAFHLIPADLDPRALLGIDGPEPRQDW